MNPAELTLGISPSLTTKPSATPLSLSTKTGKAPVPRIELEPIYTQLKAALGDQWTDYKTAINAFVLGSLNQAELSWVLQPLLSAAPSVITSTNPNFSPISTLGLHNTLLTSIYANTLRDPPPTDVAPWVVATDKPAATSKNAGASGANDKAEERLRKEVMAIHARDRRRIKTLKESGKPVNDGLTEMLDYRNELAVKPPDVVAPQGAAGGIAKTSWDVQIKQRFAQNLAAETLEFPASKDVQGRIEPICYEEGLVGGVVSGGVEGCVTLLERATEIYLKELLGQMFAHTRANAERCIQTSGYRRRLRQEEEGAERGAIQRNASGLLPVELGMQTKRHALDMDDMLLAVRLDDAYLRQDPFLSHRVMLNGYPDVPAPDAAAQGVNGVAPTVNGALTDRGAGGMEDGMEGPESEWSWRGSTKSDVNDLMGVLDECLAVA